MHRQSLPIDEGLPECASMMQEQEAAWSLTHGGVSDALRHKLFVHDGYLSEKALATALATCKSWVQMAPPGVLYAAAMHSFLLNRREGDLPKGMYGENLPVAARLHITTVIAQQLDDLSLIPKVERSDGPAPSWTVVGPKQEADVSWNWDERDADGLFPPGGRVLVALRCLAGMCEDFEVADVPAAAATALRNITARLVSIHVWENYDKCKEIELYYPQYGGRPEANRFIVHTLALLHRYSARFAADLYDVVFMWSSPRGNSNEIKLDDDDNLLLASIAPWVPVDQLDAILDVILCRGRQHRSPRMWQYVMESLLTRAGEAFAHRAEAIPSNFAARLIESARDAKKFFEDWTGARAMEKVARAMGGKATKASVRLFLPFVDDAATRPYALQLLTWVLWEDYAYSDPTFFAKEPIVTPDEFLRVASHVGAVDDDVHISLLRVLACLVRADTLKRTWAASGSDVGVLRPAVASITPRIMALIRGDKAMGGAEFDLLAEGAIIAVPGAVELLAERFPLHAVRRVAKSTTAADEVLLGALSERLGRKAAGGKAPGTKELKVIAAFGARAACIAPQLVAALSLAEAKANQDYVTSLVETLAAFGPDVYSQHAVSVAKWARKYIDDLRLYSEREKEWQAAIIQDDLSGPVRQIIQSLGMEAAPYARELVYLTCYHALEYWTHRETIEGESSYLLDRLLLPRCRTLRLVAEFGDRCPETGVSALLDRVLQWDGSKQLWDLSPVPINKRDGRLDAHIFSTLMRLGRDRLVPHADRIIANLTNTPPYEKYESFAYAVGAVEILAALLPDTRARAVLITLLTSKTPGMAEEDDDQEYDDRSIAYAAATALRAANCAVDGATAGHIARILAEKPPNADLRLSWLEYNWDEPHSVADVEAACAAELGLVES